MRFLARLGLGLCGLALVTSAVVKADDPAAPPSDAVVPQAAQVAGHHHKGLFGWRHCVECQRDLCEEAGRCRRPAAALDCCGGSDGRAYHS